MKVGLIGFGSIGKRHCENLRKFTQDVVILSKRKDISGLEVVHSWRDFFRRGRYDVFFVTNETYKHVPTILKCVSFGPRAIFVEKPLSHNSSNLNFISRYIKENRISLWVGYNLQFFEPFIYIKDFLRNNKLGRIYYFRVFAGQDLKEWRGRDYKITYSAKAKQGGGVALDLVHDINYPSWMLREKLIPKASFNAKISSLKINCEDFSESIFATPKGVMVSVHQDYLRVPGKRSLEIAFEKGSLTWDSISGTVAIETRSRILKKKIKFDYNEMYIKELEFFFDKLKKKEFFTNIEEAMTDVRIIESIRKLRHTAHV